MNDEFKGEIAIQPSFEKVAANYEKGIGSLIYLQRIDDVETPVSALSKLGENDFGSCLFESVEGGETRGRYSFIAHDPDLVFQIENDLAKIAEIDENGVQGDFKTFEANPLDVLRNIIKESKLDFDSGLPSPLAGLYGYLSYETIRYFEKLPKNEKDPLQVPTAILTRPRLVIVFDGVKQELILATPLRPQQGISAKEAYQNAINRLRKASQILDNKSDITPPKQMAIDYSLGEFKSNITPEKYKQGVEKAKDYIRAGDIFQVVPSQRFEVDFQHSPLALYRGLKRTNPSPFLFILQMKEFSIVGSSPEILVRLRDGTITLRPIAGTRLRGTTNSEDLALEEELLNDTKERAEHLMLLDLGRNDVGRVALPKQFSNQSGLERKNNGGVKVTQQFIVERYSHVMHIVSNVEGTIKPELDALDALLAGFPAGTVSGAPKIRAMEIISELEPYERGIYSGGVGYFSSNGDMDMCIALRTGVVKNKKLYIQAGAGVVLDSNPQSEHEECKNKARALLVAAKEAKRYS